VLPDTTISSRCTSTSSGIRRSPGLSKQAINDLLRQLEAMGYITLEPDPADRRARRIVLTPRGGELMECVRAAAYRIAEDWARAVGEERFEAVRRTLLDYIEAERARP
jgi:DNA-binding MarR family transcriptional regulator